MSVPLHRVNAASAANTEQTLSVTSGAGGATYQNAPHVGSVLKPILATVHFSATVTNVTITGTLDSGLGSTYDVVLVSESFSGDDWVWAIQDAFPELMILPWESGTIVQDELDLTVGAGGAGVISYAAIYYELVR